MGPVMGADRWPVSGGQRTETDFSFLKEILLLSCRLVKCDTRLNTSDNNTTTKAFRAGMSGSIIHDI